MTNAPEQPVDTFPEGWPVEENLVGKTVGRIRVVGTLGEGGMGTVYVGYDETLKRKVALKAIRHDRRLDAEVKARFLREARILSQLDHPCICRIHEIIEGEESDFLVLELIEGESLKEAMKGSLEHAFKLYVAEKVAQALVAAHDKGIAHRDLKPENVMLADDGEVKVLDFGLAYNVDGKLASMRSEAPTTNDVEAPTTTSRSSWQSTDALSHLPWEEVSPMPTASGDATDSASDAAREANREPTAAQLDALQAEGSATFHPEAPTSAAAARSDSTIETAAGVVMGTLTSMSPEQARGERVTGASDLYAFGLLLQELFSGRSPYTTNLDLPALVYQVCMGKTLPVEGIDPDLAALINRLKSLAPETRPTADETLARLRWIRAKPQRRILQGVAIVLIALFVLGALKYTSDLRRERTQAVEARREAERVSAFLVSLFEVSDPRLALDSAVDREPITARELLDEGEKRIRVELQDQPLSQARIMLTMGRVYRQLGLYDKALSLLEEALTIRRRELDAGDVEIADSLDSLASLYYDLGEYGQAEPLFFRALEIRQQALGTADPRVAASFNNLAFVYRAQGEDGRAEPLFLRALAIHREQLGADHPSVAASLNNLGDLYRSRGELTKAETALRQAMEIQERHLGADHPDLAESLNNLAFVFHEQGDVAQAEPLYQRTLAISEQALGPDHPNVASVLNNLAELHRLTGTFGEAAPLYRRARAIQEQALGPDHPSVAVTLANLADLHRAQGESVRAEALYERVAAIQEAALGPDHPDLALTLDLQADLLSARGAHAEAESRYQRALEILNQDPARNRSSLAVTLADLAHHETVTGRYEAAERHYSQARELAEDLLTAQPNRRASRHRLATIDLGMGLLQDAVGDEEGATTAWTRAATTMAPLTADSEIVADLHVHALALLHLGKVEEARGIVDALLAKGWQDTEFLALCRTSGLLADDE